VDFIVALGGNNETHSLKSATLFDPITQTWTSLPDMTTARGWGPVACVVNRTRAIACGGQGEPNEGKIPYCEELDLNNQTGGWKIINPTTAPRVHSAAVLLPDRDLFVITGGRSAETGERLQWNAVLDIRSTLWRNSIAPLTVSRISHCAVLYNNTILLLGGLEGENETVSRSAEQYDMVSSTWRAFQSFFTPRFAFGASVVLDRIYIAGGWETSNYSTQLLSVESYSGGTWFYLSDLLAVTRVDCSAVMFQDKFVVLGGSQRTVEVYDPAMVKWSTLPSLTASTRRDFLAVVASSAKKLLPPPMLGSIRRTMLSWLNLI
jgi:serine/threonine-protein kinase PknK